MRVLIVEDDPLHRAWLGEAVRAALPECREVVEATDGAEGEARAREMPDAHVVMDLQMQPRTGIDAARTIWRERPSTRILFWSNYSDEAYVRGVSRIVPPGAAYGYVLKSASGERLRLALRGIFVENQCVIDGEVRGTQQKSTAHAVALSEAEYEVLIDIALGLTDRAIAARRGLSLRSVQNRLQAIYDKLGVHAPEGQEGLYNLRGRAVSVAVLRRLLNRNTLERAEADLAEWSARRQR
ncbi:MAG: response regulator transcription factor [Rhodobacteraceae bacterium]|nr:response regulator transcription factor [Paracoccaceae bacterium]